MRASVFGRVGRPTVAAFRDRIARITAAALIARRAEHLAHAFVVAIQTVCAIVSKAMAVAASAFKDDGLALVARVAFRVTIADEAQGLIDRRRIVARGAHRDGLFL